MTKDELDTLKGIMRKVRVGELLKVNGVTFMRVASGKGFQAPWLHIPGSRANDEWEGFMNDQNVLNWIDDKRGELKYAVGMVAWND